MTIEKKDYSSFFVFLSATFCRALMFFKTFRYLKGQSGRIRMLKVVITLLNFVRLNAKMYYTQVATKNFINH
jgi:hypothetical protein